MNIPPNQISIDVIIPRPIFDNNADTYIDILYRFIRIITYLIELTTGSKNHPILTYTSTSDPVTGLAVAGTTAWAILNLYKLLLEVAEKQFSLLKALKEFRAFTPEGTPDFEERVKSIVDESLKQAVDGAIASVPHKVPDERINEIKIGVNTPPPKGGGFGLRLKAGSVGPMGRLVRVL